MNKTTFLFLFSFFYSVLSFSQEADSNPFSMSVDLVSRYVWRGTQFGNNAPNIQPGLSYNKGNFTAGFWGSYALNQAGAQEADLYIQYAVNDKFSITLTDYFFPDETAHYNYFDYNADSTGHILEASIGYDGGEKVPLKVLLATNFYGADAHKINADTSLGNIMYSTYAELTYSFTHIDAFIGANLTNVDTDRGESGFYGNHIGIVNLGISTSKTIKITNSFSVPFTVSLITNPQAEKIFLVAGFSL